MSDDKGMSDRAVTGPDGDGGPGAAGAPQTAAAVAAAQRRGKQRSLRREVPVLALVALVIALLVKSFVVQAFYIPSSSMEDTLLTGDKVLVNKVVYHLRTIEPGDIVVFSHPPLDHCGGPQGGDLVKRVIALPGQTIYSSGNSIYVNGRLLAEPYLPHNDPLGPPIPDASSQHPYRVPPGEFYMLGDNLAISCDSRYWGPIKGSSIIGKVVLVLWHDDRPDFRRF